MRQCELQYRDADVVKIKTGWLEHNKLKLGCFVSLKDDPDILWEVTKISEEVPKDVVLDRSQDYKRTRLASDI